MHTETEDMEPIIPALNTQEKYQKNYVIGLKNQEKNLLQ